MSVEAILMNVIHRDLVRLSESIQNLTKAIKESKDVDQSKESG